SAAGGSSNTIVNPPALAGHAMVRVSGFGGSSGLRLDETDLVVADNQGNYRDIFLPALNVLAGDFAYLWVSFDGSTYYAEADQSSPDFSNLARGSIMGFVALEPGFRIEVA